MSFSNSLTGAAQPRILDKYRVVRELGVGGMAQLFLAALEGPDGFIKLCVLKRILPALSRDPSFAAMFLNEAKVAAMLSHPNIVQIFELGEDGDQYYLAMEYVEGLSLDRLMGAARRADQSLGPRVAVEVGLPVSSALAYAHDFALADGTPLSLVHRDIAPDNILVSRDGVVKLTDFGVVKTAINQHGTAAGVVKGKWSYMSPEQVLALPVDRRSDLFSLGIILYELATGVRLFRGDSLPQTANAVARAEVIPPSHIVPDFPPGLERILMKALAREPAQRYQTAAQLGAYLDAFRASQSWTNGNLHLAAMLDQLCPSDGSPLPPLDPVSEPSTGGRLATPAYLSSRPTISVLDNAAAPVTPAAGRPVSFPIAFTVLAAVAATSVLFWFLLG